MKEKKKKGRRAWLDDIKLNEEGSYSYQGVCYRWAEAGRTRGQTLAGQAALGLALAACVLAAGCIPAPGMGNCVYLVLPYTVQVIAAVSVCWALARLAAGGNPVREYVYQATVEKLPGRAAASAAPGVLVMAGELVYIGRNGVQGEIVPCILLFVLEAAGMAAALTIRRGIQRLTWERVKSA